MEEAELASIREELARAEKCERTFRTALSDAGGVVHAEVERLVHVRRRAG